MKSLAKSLVSRAAAASPWGIRKALYQGLSTRNDRFLDAALVAGHLSAEDFGHGFARLSALAQSLNVDAFLVRGDYGVIQSSSGDYAVLSHYARTGRFGEITNTVLGDFFTAHDGGTYIDIGANIGLTTIPVARDPRVSCLAIEPEPTNYANLVANVTRNCAHGNVQTRQLAVFSKAGSLEFEIADDNLGDHRLRIGNAEGALHEEQRPVISVDAMPLDAIAPPIRGKLAVKIDVQGAEPFVIQGGRQTLLAADLLVMEFWPYSMARMGADFEVVLEFLRQFTTVSLAQAESDDASEPAPPARIIDALRTFVRDHSDSRGAMGGYLDIIARK